MQTRMNRLAGVSAAVGAAALIAWAESGCSGSISPEEETKLRGRVTAYLDALKGAEFTRAYKEFWKLQARRPEEMEAFFALQWQNNGTFVRHAIQEVKARASDDADVTVTIVMLVRDASSNTEKEETSVQTMRWSVQNGNWYLHGDMKGPGG